VSSVAYAPSVVETRSFGAPVASLIGRLGPPRPAPAASRGGVDPRLLLAIMLTLLLVEWTSRRLRGLK
jgi:hypothetical protein